MDRKVQRTCGERPPREVPTIPALVHLLGLWPIFLKGIPPPIPLERKKKLVSNCGALKESRCCPAVRHFTWLVRNLRTTTQSVANTSLPTLQWTLSHSRNSLRNRKRHWYRTSAEMKPSFTGLCDLLTWSFHACSKQGVRMKRERGRERDLQTAPWCTNWSVVAPQVACSPQPSPHCTLHLPAIRSVCTCLQTSRFTASTINRWILQTFKFFQSQDCSLSSGCWMQTVTVLLLWLRPR